MLDALSPPSPTASKETRTVSQPLRIALSPSALDKFRDQPSKIGRARLAGERSIGRDDPGMFAFKRA